MLIFVERESNAVLPVTGHVITAPVGFQQAINLLAESKLAHANDDGLVVFKDFFSVGCKNLTPAMVRGLERIAMGARGTEVTNGTQYTRFLMLSNEAELAVKIELRRKLKEFDGIGSLLPDRTLIVGDTPGGRALHDVPFVGTGSGLWLSEQLEANGIDERKLCWINSTQANGLPRDPTLVEELKPREIIALGANAQAWAKDIDCCPVIEVAHPAFWMRFHRNEPYKLFEYL